MHHYSEPLIDSKGNALTGYYVKVISPADGSVQTLYADPSLTPIISVSGIADAAQCDSDGMVDFYVGVGTYHLDIYATDGVTLIRRRQNIGMNIDMDTAAAAVEAETAAAASAEAAAASALDSSDSAASSAASALAAAAVFSGTAGVVALPRFTPEAYMAPGRVEGTTDDGPALAAMSAAVNAIGRGAVDFYSGRTYWVGSQTLNAAGPAAVAGATMRYAPNTPYPVEINGCTGPVVINMNGARIKCLPSKRYGSFNADGTDYVGLATLPAYAGTPYFAMIWIHGCSGSVVVLNGELDGNIAAQNIGGGYGDNNIQFPMDGVYLGENTGPVWVDVHSHHHGRDGMVGDGIGNPAINESVSIAGRYNHNGRQGLSLVGGVGWKIEDGTEFYGTGKDLGADMTYSLPAAGIDLEPSGGKWVKNLTIGKVYIADNAGPGLTSPSATLCSNIDVIGATIIGTTNYSVWGLAKRLRFKGGRILGAMVYLYADADPELAAQFEDVDFPLDANLSPTGVLYPGGTGADQWFNASGGSINLRFRRCRFSLMTLPNVGIVYTQLYMPDAWFEDCSFYVDPTVYASYADAFLVYGTFEGARTNFSLKMGTVPSLAAATTIGSGMAYGGQSFDTFTHNGTRYPADSSRATGKKVYYGTATYNPPSLALAAKDSIQTMTVTGVALGDSVEDVSFSLNLAGARIVAWVSAANTVSYYAINENGANPLDLASGTVRVKVRQA